MANSRSNRIEQGLTHDDVLNMGYVYARLLSNGDWAGILPMTFGKGRLCSGINNGGHEDAWCYSSIERAILALDDWDTAIDDEPFGWMRHPTSGRRRENGLRENEIIAP